MRCFMFTGLFTGVVYPGPRMPDSMDTAVDTGMDTALGCQCMHVLDGDAANGATGTTRNKKPGAVAGSGK